MGTIDIIYLVLVGITLIIGFIFAFKLIGKIRYQSIDQFNQKQIDNRRKIKNGRHN